MHIKTCNKARQTDSKNGMLYQADKNKKVFFLCLLCKQLYKVEMVNYEANMVNYG